MKINWVKIAEAIGEVLAVKGSGSGDNLKSKSTLGPGAIAAAGFAYAMPPQTKEDWIILGVSLLIGVAGFYYREKH